MGVQLPAPPQLVFGSRFNILRCKCQGACVIGGEGQPFQGLVKTRKQQAAGKTPLRGPPGAPPQPALRVGAQDTRLLLGQRPLLLSNTGCLHPVETVK